MHSVFCVFKIRKRANLTVYRTNEEDMTKNKNKKKKIKCKRLELELADVETCNHRCFFDTKTNTTHRKILNFRIFFDFFFLDLDERIQSPIKPQRSANKPFIYFYSSIVSKMVIFSCKYSAEWVNTAVEIKK